MTRKQKKVWPDTRLNDLGMSSRWPTLGLLRKTISNLRGLDRPFVDVLNIEQATWDALKAELLATNNTVYENVHGQPLMTLEGTKLRIVGRPWHDSPSPRGAPL